MTTFRSPEVTISKSGEYIFNKIGNLNNLKEIMPPRIQDFNSTENSCSFKIKGLPKLSLEITEKTEFSKISLTAKDSEVPFSLDCLINNNEEEEKCQVILEIKAELNLMMKMMVEKPLTNFLELLSQKIQNI